MIADLILFTTTTKSEASHQTSDSESVSREIYAQRVRFAGLNDESGSDGEHG
ncbi:hypothetical protein PGT21_008644, partial [Puccinia graminis f. sp. tritici]